MPAWTVTAGGQTNLGPATTVMGFPFHNDTSNVENVTQYLIRDNYTLSFLQAYFSWNTTGAASAIRCRKNGANQTQWLNIPAGATGRFTDIVNSDAFVSGDLLNNRIFIGAGGNVSYDFISYVFTSVNNAPVQGASSVLAVVGVAFNSIGFFTLFGYLTNSAVADEDHASWTIRTGATLSNFRIFITANTLNGNAVATMRVNLANGTETVNVPAGATGGFEDAVNTDIIAIGDIADWQLDTTAAGAGNISSGNVGFKSTSAARRIASQDGEGAVGIAAGLTQYRAPEGSSDLWNVNEPENRVVANTPFTARNMFVNIRANTNNTGVTARLRRNGGNSTILVSIPALGVGVYEDLVNSQAYLAADDFGWMAVTAGALGTVYIAGLGFEQLQPTVGGSAFPGNVGRTVMAMR